QKDEKFFYILLLTFSLRLYYVYGQTLSLL
ncbi:TGS domain protein, partial [Chlamydia psittaci 84-8471/1]